MTIDIEKLAKEIGKQKLSVMRPSMSGHQQMLLDGFDFTKSELKRFAEALLEDKEHVTQIDAVKFQEALDAMCADKDRVIAEANEAAQILANKMCEYQAHINDLREALEDIAKHTPENFWQNKAAQQAISKTPAQSLQSVINETIGRVIDLMEDMNANGKYHLPDYIVAIRALKQEVK